MRHQFEREEELLAKQLADGLITTKEYNDEMRELQRDYRAAMEEACIEAAERERESW